MFGPAEKVLQALMAHHWRKDTEKSFDHKATNYLM